SPYCQGDNLSTFVVLLNTLVCYSFLSTLPPPPNSTLFPYTTLFRSVLQLAIRARLGRADTPGADRPLLRYWPAGCHETMPKKRTDRKSTRLNSSHQIISYAVFCLKKKKKIKQETLQIKTITITTQ